MALLSGDAAYLRCIALLRRRQHAVIGRQSDAPHPHAVEDLAVTEAVAKGQLRTPGRQGPLQVRGGVLIRQQTATGSPGLAALVAQAPVAEVDAAVEAQVTPTVPRPRRHRCGAEGVIEQRNVEPSVPAGRVNVTARGTAEVGLGDTDVECQGLGVELAAGQGDPLGKFTALRVGATFVRWQHDSELGKFQRAHARLDIVLPLPGDKADFTAPRGLPIEHHIHTVDARRQCIARIETRNIHGSGKATGERLDIKQQWRGLGRQA